MRSSHALLCATGVLLAACGTKPIKQSDMHIQQTPDTVARSSGTIPQPSKQAVVLPPPKTAAKVETYSVVVTNLPAREILFALARDAKINIDIHGGIDGVVTLNAINQTLPQILDRISKQVEMRYELKGDLLVVMPDSPFLKSYKIDYVNMARDAEGGISNTTQVGGSSGGTGGGGGANNSQLSIKNSSKNHFWDTLVKNITDILRETDKVLPQGSSEVVVQQQKTESKKGDAATADQDNAAIIEGEGSTVTRRSTFREAASVIPNPEAGIITVRATGKQHEKIQEFITHVMRNARRQVLIEATIAEVRLSSNYQQGIDWQRLRLGAKGFGLKQVGSPGLGSTNTGSMMVLDYLNPTSKLGNLSASVSLLDTFGDVKVLSSPKLSVMNNQTAMLRVVDNLVYFTIKADTTTNQTTTTTTYTTTPITVPTGFTMSVTPQINDSDTVLLNLRPSITRLLGYVNDPNPALAAAGVTSRIPQLQSREMESMLKIENNQIAILGGLMQDEINNLTDGIPLLDDIPLAGNAFRNRNDTKTKTELVIFLRPVVIKDASLDGDFSAFRDALPNGDFLKPESEKETR
ncbi:MAG: pilus (MSHA type) biogenesis protein MshL [Gammaproteobacteria bacterium]|nr:pilus (MSHA type) biogenesis protein MshL [Sideroxydans sp.]MBU3903417.1 pilus (MSHA type) biogenesis protein MshL [Gammaproteobacteria bacterium]